jgi:hypothetical protein
LGFFGWGLLAFGWGKLSHFFTLRNGPYKLNLKRTLEQALEDNLE